MAPWRTLRAGQFASDYSPGETTARAGYAVPASPQAYETTTGLLTAGCFFPLSADVGLSMSQGFLALERDFR